MEERWSFWRFACFAHVGSTFVSGIYLDFSSLVWQMLRVGLQGILTLAGASVLNPMVMLVLGCLATPLWSVVSRCRKGACWVL